MTATMRHITESHLGLIEKEMEINNKNGKERVRDRLKMERKREKLERENYREIKERKDSP